jgi:hypothetical protein
MKPVFKIGQTLATGLLLSIFSLHTASAQTYDPTPIRGLESHVKGFIKAVNGATPTDISEIPLEKARGIYSYATTVSDKFAIIYL